MEIEIRWISCRQIPCSCIDGSDRTEQELHTENEHDVVIKLFLEPTLLLSWRGGVHHYLRLMSCVDDNSIDVIGISQWRASEQQLIAIDWHRVGNPLIAKGSFKLVDLIIVGLAVDLPVEVDYVGFLFQELHWVLRCHLMFQISFAVKVLCLHITDSFVWATLDQDHVCGEELVSHDLHNLTHLQTLPCLRNKIILLFGCNQNFLSIFLFVRSISFPIF